MIIKILANCHGVIYKNIIQRCGFNGLIENIISYENVGQPEKIRDWISDADILVMQPIFSYPEFSKEKIARHLKPSAHLIEVPFYRFNGFWPLNDERRLEKFPDAAVMFFPKIYRQEDVAPYLTERKTTYEEVANSFDRGVEELRVIDRSGDIKFLDQFLALYKEIPLFRDPYHPTFPSYSIIAKKIIEEINRYKKGTIPESPKIASRCGKEYGHFKPLKNVFLEHLGLNFDPNSYLNPCSLSRK